MAKTRTSVRAVTGVGSMSAGNGTAAQTGEGGRVVVPALPVQNMYRTPTPGGGGPPPAVPRVTVIPIGHVPCGPGTADDSGGYGAGQVASNDEGSGGAPNME